MTKSDRRQLLRFFEDQWKGYYWMGDDRSKLFYANKAVAASEVCKMFGITEEEMERRRQKARKETACESSPCP